MNPTPTPTPRRGAALAAAALAAAALLAGCQTHPPAATDATPAAPVANATSAPQAAMTLPPTSVGEWVDLGAWRAPWLGGDAPVPISGPNARTRVAGLKQDDGRWLAIIVLQTAPGGYAPCPRQDDLHLHNAPSDHCLRMRGNADFDRWMERQHGVLYHWLQGQGWAMQPRAWVGYRLPAAGGTMEAHALLHPALLAPTTRNNQDFLSGGHPGVDWAHRFASAVRSAAAGDSALNVPPLPFAPPVLPPLPAPAPEKAELPTAEQVPPPPPAQPPAAPRQAPRADRQ